MREAFDGIKKIPHPEEAAKQLSRRTHAADPAQSQFLTRSFARDDEGSGDTVSWEHLPACLLPNEIITARMTELAHMGAAIGVYVAADA